MFDYVGISGSMDGRVIEYVDHLHDHFEDPVVIRGGRYMPPSRPGYSITMRPKTLRDYAYPKGAAWKSRGSTSTRGAAP
jgi:L-fuconate dehydratase